MKHIMLTKGYFALVNDEDDEALSKHKWTAVVMGKRVKRVYAYRRTGWDNLRRRYTRTIYMHREILSAPDGFDVDHISGDTLDNQRENLRIATRSQNLANNRRAIGTSGYRGVSPTTSGELAPFKVLCRGKLIGTFHDKIEAAKAYDAAAVKEFGEFAKLNFPEATQSA